MMTWYLWRAFYDSLPNHPLFWQTLNWRHQRKLQQEDRFGRVVKLIAVAALGMAIFLTMGFGVILFFMLAVYLVPFGGAIVGGANAAIGVGSVIALEREQGRYDLVALTPSGMFGVGWALGTRYLRTNRGVIRLKRLVQGLHIVIFLMLVGIYGLLTLGMGYWRDLDASGLFDLIAILIVLAALHLDFVQAVLCGALTGMLASTYRIRRLDVSLASLAIFLLAQLAVYLTTGIGLMFSLVVLERSGIQDYGILLALIGLILVYMTHEVALYCIWQVTQRRLNIESDVLQTLDRYGS